jgi:hypothetical protein
VTLCLMFYIFLICAPFVQYLFSPMPAALSGVGFRLPFCAQVFADVVMYGIQLFLLLFYNIPVFCYYLYRVVVDYF